MDKFDSLFYAVLCAVVCAVARSLIIGYFRSKNKK